MAYLSLLLPAPIMLYACWRWAMAGEPFVPIYWLLPASLLGAAFGLLWLRRRQWVQAMVVPTFAVLLAVGICFAAYSLGRNRVETACEEALRLPVGQYAPVLRQINANPEVTCIVGDRVSETWFVRIETAGRGLGSMWLALDDDDELVLRRASLEPLSSPRPEDALRTR